METTWFVLVAIGITIYVVLDGFDIGAGALHLIAGRDKQERSQILASISPFWDGNEVWLLAGGGTLYFAFPVLYSSAFSGFYLPLMIVLWLLILRGISIEFRNHMDSPVWVPFWDFTFCVASALLAVFFGAALGNVVRGVPLDQNAEFFLPLWTDFRVSPNPGILDWYTILTGLTALAALAMHGALWIQYKVHDPMESRAAAIAGAAWWVLLVLTVALTFASFQIQPLLGRNFVSMPWGYLFPALAIGGLLYARLKLKDPQRALGTFLGSCCYLAGMLLSVVFSLYPYVLPATGATGQLDRGLTIYKASAERYGLGVGLVWWIPALCLATAYFFFLYRRFAGKVERPAGA